MTAAQPREQAVPCAYHGPLWIGSATSRRPGPGVLTWNASGLCDQHERIQANTRQSTGLQQWMHNFPAETYKLGTSDTDELAGWLPWLTGTELAGLFDEVQQEYTQADDPNAFDNEREAARDQATALCEAALDLNRQRDHANAKKLP